MSIDDLVCDGEAQAGPAGPSGKERIEDAFEIFFRNPNSLVNNLE